MSLPPEDKHLAEAVLQHLCLGAQIDGIRFGPILQLLITQPSSPSSTKPISGQTYLNLGSTWTVFETLPDALPDQEDDLPEPSVDEQLGQLCALRGAVITDICLGAEQPHLILTFEGDRVFFLNGRHDLYEPWQLGVTYGQPGEIWLLVACPGGGIAVWMPDHFAPPI